MGYFINAWYQWNQKPAIEKPWAEFNSNSNKEYRAWQDMQPMSAGVFHKKDKTLVETNKREL